MNRIILDAVTQGSPAVVTALAIFAALVVGGLLIAFSDTTVLHAWGSFFSTPGAAISAAWHSVAAAYSALFEGAIFNPHTIAAAFHGGSVGAIFYPLSQTASQATPLILTGLSVALAFRAGLFNIGAAEPVDRRRDRGHLPWLRGQPAAGHPRDRLPGRRVRWRRGDRLAGRRASRRGPGRTR